MSNKIWNVITHHETPAFGAGDYDEYYEVVNERGDALQATDYDGLEQIADALNGFEGNLRITTALEINQHCDNQMLKAENDHLKAENSKMRKALEVQEWIPYKEGHPLPDYDEVVLWRDCEGNYLAEPLDKDGNPWLDEPLPVTHWKKIIPPKE